MTLKIKKLTTTSVVPTRATSGSAGLDLYADISEPVTINPGSLVTIPTGIAVSVPPNHAAFIYARSGLGIKHGINLSNGVGVVDSDYRGEVKVGLCNVSGEAYTVKPQERIAQMVIMPVVIPEISEVAELDDTIRGEGGFGSSGK